MVVCASAALTIYWAADLLIRVVSRGAEFLVAIFARSLFYVYDWRASFLCVGLHRYAGACGGSVVFPSGFLPVSAGNVRERSLQNLYRDSALFQSLCDANNLKGKCGRCEYKQICGGSRARAFALTNNVCAEEPCCVYQPKQSASSEGSRRTQSSEEINWTR